MPPHATTAASTVDWERIKNIIFSTIGAVVLLAGLALVAQRLSKVLLIIVMAALIAYIAEPAVSRLGRVLPRLAAAIAVYVAFLALVAGAGMWLVQQLAPQIAALAQDLPSDIAKVQVWVAAIETSVGQPGIISSQLGGVADALKGGSGATVGTGLGFLVKAGDTLTTIVLTLVVSIYFVLDAGVIWKAIRKLVPKAQVYRFNFAETQLNRIVGGYIRGQLLMALIIGASTGVGMFALGVRFPLVIALAAFIFELVPMVGPVLAGLLALSIAAFQGFPLVLYVLAFYAVLQLVESNVLGPRISGHAVGLHPVASILALVVGADLFGLWGAIMAVPLAGLAFVIVSAVIKQLRGEPVEGLIEPRKHWAPVRWPKTSRRGRSLPAEEAAPRATAAT
ncbi:MAG TPA: AI-2E family transporter [Chloroflexota bacterium]|nr:AI-2E family transporter [Chloroflexota bacterium]